MLLEQLKNIFNSPVSYPQEMDLYFYAASHGDNAAVAKFLNKYPDKADQKDHWGWTGLMWAARFGYADTVKLLLEKGATTDIQNNDGLTALMLAQTHDRTGAVVVLERWAKKQRPADIKPLSLG